MKILRTVASAALILSLSACALNPFGGLSYIWSDDRACAECVNKCGDRYLPPPYFQGDLDLEYSKFQKCCVDCPPCREVEARRQALAD